MLRYIFLVIIALLLLSYSILRYLHLWKRGRASEKIYYGIHILSLAVCGIVLLWPVGLVFDPILFAGHLYVYVYSSVMLLTPVFCFLRGIVRFLGKRFQWTGRVYRYFNHPSKMIILILIVTSLIGLYGFGNEKYVRKTEYSVALDKEAQKEEISVILVSDLRVGSSMTQFELSRLVEKINEQQPDLILFCGNLIDKRVSDGIFEKTLEKLAGLSASDGIYIVGGSEDFSILSESADKLEQKGIHLLLDKSVSLSSGVQLVGCRDRSDGLKKPLDYVTSLLNPDKPSILLSHERVDDPVLQEKRVDYVLSGAKWGQYGTYKNGTTHFLSTSGLSSRLPGKYAVPSEIVHITLQF